MVISDIDGTLLDEDGNRDGVDELREVLENRSGRFAFGVASGRHLSLIQEVLEENRLPMPDLIIGSVGSTIHYGYNEDLVDRGWARYISNRWHRDQILEGALKVPHLTLQPETNQRDHKISFFIEDEAFDENRLFTALGSHLRHVNVIISRGRYVDILPKRASKGRAVRYLSQKWSTPLRNCILCGDSGNDLDMMQTAFKGVVVSNYAPELEVLRERKDILFTSQPATLGVLEGLKTFKLI
jgi:sucrose-phosphate synthase